MTTSGMLAESPRDWRPPTVASSRQVAVTPERVPVQLKGKRGPGSCGRADETGATVLGGVARQQVQKRLRGRGLGSTSLRTSGPTATEFFGLGGEGTTTEYSCGRASAKR